jgi:sugar phosphate permease
VDEPEADEPVRPVAPPRYRWAVLAAGTAAAAAQSASLIGLPVLAPALREEWGLTLGQVGVVLASVWIGPTLTLLPWGLLADRLGERLVLAAGLGGSGIFLGAAGAAPGYLSLVLLLALAGAAGVSVNSASGRAVMQWFEAGERGYALGIRQTAIPLGGVVAALGLPPLEHAFGVRAAFVVLGGLAVSGALAGWLVLRERAAAPAVEAEVPPWTLRDGRLWRLCGGSGLYLVAQTAVMGFVVLFLHDERGFSTAAAAAVLAAAQALAVGARIGAGRWSDALGSRIVPLRRIGLAVVATLGLSAALTGGPAYLLVPSLVVAGALSMAWNGLSFTAAAELAGRARSGAAIGIQQTVLSAFGTVVPVAFAATVAAVSWRTAFALAALGPLAGWLVLRPLR